MENRHDYSDELLPERELLRRRIACAALVLTEASQEYNAAITALLAYNEQRRDARLNRDN